LSKQKKRNATDNCVTLHFVEATSHLAWKLRSFYVSSKILKLLKPLIISQTKPQATKV